MAITLRLVELGSAYWFRSLARGPHGEALVLTYDGSVQVIDPESGRVTASIPAIGAWEEKENWQEPGHLDHTPVEVAVVDGLAEPAGHAHH